MRKILLGCLYITLVLGLSLGPQTVSAFELGPFDASCYFRNQTWVRAWDGPDDLMQCRNEFNLDLTYDKIPHLKLFAELRPFYDLAYDWSDSGTGGAAKHLRSGWAHNVVRNNDRDPFLRECYADITAGKWFARIGKQQVSWGKSDGIYMLDVINPLCGRNPFVWETEDLKVPLWMFNVTRSIEVCDFKGDLQVICIPYYQEAVNPGHRLSEDGYHDWGFNVFGLGNDVTMAFDDYFRNVLGIPEGYPLIQKDPANTFENFEWGVRWSGFAGGWSYTINYFYTWSELNDWPDTGDPVTAMATLRRPDRLSLFGFSVDRYWEPLQGVTRLEWVYTKGQPFVLPTTSLEEKDQIGYMAGYDRWIFTDWLISFQLQQLFILDPVHHKNAYCGPGAYEFDWVNMVVANGMIDPVRTNMTAYVMHDGFFVGDTGHLESLLLWDATEGSKWWFAQFRYDIDDHWQVGIGCNLFWGNEDDTIGEFRDNDNIFFMIKWGFN